MSDTVLISEPQARLIYLLHREVGYTVGQPIPPTVAPHESANLNALANLGLLDVIDPFGPTYALTQTSLEAYDAWARAESTRRVESPLPVSGRESDAQHRRGEVHAAQNRAAHYRACLLEITKIIESHTPSPLEGEGRSGGDTLTEIYLLCEHHLDLIDSILESDPLPDSPLPLREGEALYPAQG